jgi:pimeloyl-ACP methyl ester carboxylesterase
LNRKKGIKLFSIALGIIFIFGVFLSSCLQFRMSDKRQTRKLKRAGVVPELGLVNGQGRDIHYTLAGKDSSKPLVLFVHGSPGSSSNFLRYAKDSALLQQFQVLLVDRPGFGYSDFGDEEKSILKQAEILNDVLQQFKASKKVLVGHSLGGPIIARMAMDSTAEIDGLVIVAGSVSPELEPEEAWRKTFNKAWLRWVLPKLFRVSNQEIIDVRQDLIAMEDGWKNIRIPVRIVQGGKDKLVPAGNADYAKQMLINSPDVHIHMLVDENHFIPFTMPEVVRQAILELQLN